MLNSSVIPDEVYTRYRATHQSIWARGGSATEFGVGSHYGGAGVRR